ncbi:transcription factor E2F3 [Chelmon rostratus]|uniref:transcription factor E2F3 n=1 Tax=Chelmon rostratus TaxID=109905 RepID=UPI001BEB022C|nr:transcription factor E2F3 [Chelmon rostratus]
MRKGVPSVSEGSVAFHAGCSETSSPLQAVSSPSGLSRTVRLGVRSSEPTDSVTNATPHGPSTHGTEQKSKPKRVQAKRKLELEAGDPQDLKDGFGGPTWAQYPMASPSHTGGKASATEPKAHRPLCEKSRYDTSLSLLTRRFAELLGRSTDGVVDLNIVAQELNVAKRRIYDVTNVLEGIQLLQKTSKSHFKWLGSEVKKHTDYQRTILIEKEKKLDELIQSCMQQVHQICESRHRFAYLTYDDIQRIPSLREQTVIVIKAPAQTKLEVPHPAESLQVHLRSTQGPIEVFLCSDDPINMEATDSCVASDSHLNSSTNGHMPYMSSVQVSSKDSANHTSRISTISNPLSKPTQPSSPPTSTPVSPLPTSLQNPSEDQQNFVTLTPPLAVSLSREEYLLSLAEDEGITDLFSSVDLDQLPLDVPL